jgi:hypothetical protein
MPTDYRTLRVLHYALLDEMFIQPITNHQSRCLRRLQHSAQFTKGEFILDSDVAALEKVLKTGYDTCIMHAPLSLPVSLSPSRIDSSLSHDIIFLHEWEWSTGTWNRYLATTCAWHVRKDSCAQLTCARTHKYCHMMM